MGKKLKDMNYVTTAPKQETFTIQIDSAVSNPKSIPGDSVDEHKQLEVANSIIAGDEIKQQNENN
ncbi:hypothetical protein [Bacillus marasmi]|uniref:hypothetical protein n=1 Tax=Bacillus marasmi TaxID=1926279 RepID=UPI0011C7B4CF|nr:hypothetical protein [Bacillus marasmi]